MLPKTPLYQPTHINSPVRLIDCGTKELHNIPSLRSPPPAKQQTSLLLFFIPLSKNSRKQMIQEMRGTHWSPFPYFPNPLCCILRNPNANGMFLFVVIFFLALCHTFLMHPYLTHPGNCILLNSHLQQKLEGVGKGVNLVLRVGNGKKKRNPKHK